MKYVKNPETWKCYFSLTRDGKPLKIQRTIFSECFYLMALSELAIATEEEKYKVSLYLYATCTNILSMYIETVRHAPRK